MSVRLEAMPDKGLKIRSCPAKIRTYGHPNVYAVFLRLPCESIPLWHHFHHTDKLFTAREFNVRMCNLHVQSVQSTVCCPSRTLTK